MCSLCGDLGAKSGCICLYGEGTLEVRALLLEERPGRGRLEGLDTGDLDSCC